MRRLALVIRLSTDVKQLLSFIPNVRKARRFRRRLRRARRCGVVHVGRQERCPGFDVVVIGEVVFGVYGTIEARYLIAKLSSSVRCMLLVDLPHVYVGSTSPDGRQRTGRRTNRSSWPEGIRK